MTWVTPDLLVPVRVAPKVTETPPDPGEMYAELMEAATFLAEAGRPTPCTGPGASAWTSDDPDDQEFAADRCMDCPLAEVCREYALAAGVTAGVWGGYVAEHRRRKRHQPSAEAKARAKARRRARRAEGNCGEVSRHVFLGSGAENPSSEDRNGYPTMNTKANQITGTCTCGCGAETSKRANYRPGHDARHVSTLIGYLENDLADGKKITAREIASLAKQLPSAALQAKFRRAAERFAAKAATSKPEPKAGEAA